MSFVLPLRPHSIYATVLALTIGLAMLVAPGAAAQNTDGPSGSIGEIINDIKLGVQVQAGLTQSQRDILPLQENTLPYLQQPVGGDASYRTPSYGLGVELRYDAWSLSFDYLLNDGVASGSWLTFRGGGNAIPIEPSVQQWTLEGQYLWRETIGLGIGYRDGLQNLQQDLSTPIQGQRVSSILFEARSSQELVYLYVPLRYELSFGDLYGRLGASVYGTANESYRTDFVQYQSPGSPGRVTQTGVEGGGPFSNDSASMNVQFARAGVAVPVSQVVLRAGLHSERVSVSSLTTTWSYGMHVEIGLPF